MSVEVRVPAPLAPLRLAELFALQQEHRGRGLVLMDGDGNEKALDGDWRALVAALLRLSQEALLLHDLALSDPGRPVGEVLAQAVRQLRWS